MKTLITLFLGLLLPCFAQQKEQTPSGVINPSLPTLWIVGDSTVKNSGEGRGWGQELPAFFDPMKINVVNRAIGGRSSRSFLMEGRWQSVLDEMKSGDFVLIQFGHNDSGKIDDPARYRASLPDIGEETKDIIRNDGTHETVHTYGWYLRNYARTAKAKQVRVIFCSPIPHKQYDAEGGFVPNGQRWQEYVSRCALEEKTDYVDLTEWVNKVYRTLDQKTIDGFFSDPRTHTNRAGAIVNAKALLTGLKTLPGLPFTPFLNPEGAALPDP